MAAAKQPGLTEAKIADASIHRGAGGETHQVAGGDVPVLTTQQGVPVSDDQNSLRVGPRGPTLLEDFHFREKIFHFDHERIPERVVHARGYGAHGFFETYESLSDITRADIFQRAGEKTPAFVRFSTVAGNKGSPDLARDVRGFAVKLYTKEGNWDIVGNNIPVFFIQDAIKFPDLIHAAKQEPDRGFPQAQTAHDNFWDFVSLTPEVDPHADVDHVRPDDPALVPLHGGVRRPHLPAGGRRRQVDVREVPLEAEARHAVGGVERGGEAQRRRPGLPSARPVGLRSRPAISRNGSSGSSCSTRSSPRSSRSTCWTRPSSFPRRWCRSGVSAGSCSIAASTTSSPKPSRWRSARRISCPGSISPTIRCCRAATSPTSTPS